MKKLIFVLFVLVAMSGYSQVIDDGTRGKYPTRTEANAAFGTKVGQDSLRVEMPLKLNIDSAAVKYVNKLTDGFSLTDSFYVKRQIFTKDEVAAKTKKSFEKLIWALGGKAIFPSFATATLWNASYTLVAGSSVGTFYMVEDTVVADGVAFYTTTNADYTSPADTATSFNGFALYESTLTPPLTLNRLTKTKSTAQIWDVGTASGAWVIDYFNTETTLYPNHVYWVEAYWNPNTTTTAPTYLTFGGIATRNIFGYFSTGINDTNIYPATSYTNPTDYAGLSHIPGLVIICK